MFVTTEFREIYCPDTPLPFFGSEDQTQEYWSWRAIWVCANNPGSYKFDEPWNSEYNLPLLLKDRDSEEFFTCPCDQPQEKKASYVAVKGPGTYWTEAMNGTINNDDFKYSNMIVLIETVEPKNHWAEPGDDVSPKDVIRMFEADPGLVKNSKQSRFSRQHYPKFFATVIGTVGSFDEIKNVEELKKRLVIEVPEE